MWEMKILMLVDYENGITFTYYNSEQVSSTIVDTLKK
jgi:hypothetical protein